jgi:hypothetical protein
METGALGAAKVWSETSITQPHAAHQAGSVNLLAVIRR